MHRRIFRWWMHMVLVLLAATLVLMPGTAQAAIIAYDGFPYTTNTNLDGHNLGFGWAGAYSTASGGPVSATVVAGSIPTGGLATTGNSVLTAPASVGQTDNQRTLGTTVGGDGTTVFLSFLIRPSEGVNLGSHGSYGGFALGNLFVGKLESGFYGLSNFDGSGAVSSTVAPVLNSTAFLVVRMTFQSGVDTFDLFIDPVPGQPLPTTPNATKTDLDLGTTSSIDILSDHAFGIDEVRLGDTFADVTPVAAVPSSAIVFQSQSTGQVGIWAMSGTHVVGSQLTNENPLPGWNVVGTGDFNQDGKPDLVFQNQTTGQIVIWFMNGSLYLGGATVGSIPAAGFQVVGVADMDGDGKPDLVLQNRTTGQIVLWFVDGGNVVGGVMLPQLSAPGLNLVAAADFDFNGTADLLFQDQTTGEVVVWYMNRTVFTSSATLATVPDPGWQLVAAADYNSDGRPDLVFQNTTTNQLAFWYLQNFAFIGGDLINPIPDPDYKVVGPR